MENCLLPELGLELNVASKVNHQVISSTCKKCFDFFHGLDTFLCNNPLNMGTKLSGIGAAECIDSSGEILKIDGLDITSILDGSAFLNYEHLNTSPTNGCIGKILSGKKIFSEADCETPDQLKWWKKAQVPYLYIIGELFDEDGHSSAIDVAAMLKYDDRLRKQGLLGKDGLKPIVNFSVEGAKLKAEGPYITRSIVRKVSVTVLACNKICEAALYNEQVQNANATDPGTSGKVLSFSEIKQKAMQKKAQPGQMLKSEHPAFAANKGKIQEIMKKADGVPQMNPTPAKPQAPAKNAFDGWSHQDHKDAVNKHYNAATKTSDNAMKQHHMKQVNFHMRMASKIENRVKPTIKPMMPKLPKMGEVKKADAAPTSLAGNVALEKEQVHKKMFKNENLAIPVWKKVQEFRSWLGQRAPSLSQDEVEAVTRLVSHSKWNNVVKGLKDI